jgi:hypothetical protein
MALGLPSPEKSQQKSGSSSSSDPEGPYVETSVSRSQGDRIRYPRGFGLASTRASAEAKPLGGSRLNPRGVRWESVGTSWSTGGDEVTSGTDCTVVSGTRVTPSKPFASVLASCVCSSSSQTRGRCPTRPPLGRRRRRLARQPTRARLLLGLGCPASSSVGRGEGGVSSNVVFPPRGEDVVDSAAGGRAVGRHCRCCTAGEGVSCPGLERLLETAHLELDGKLFVNTQQAPTWRANCRHFKTGGSLGRRVKCRRVPQPRWVGTRPSAKGGKRRPETGVREVEIPRPSCSSRAQVGCACSRGLQASTRERERAASRERLSRPCPRAANPL